MRWSPAQKLFAAWVCLILLRQLAAADSGPTLHFDYGSGAPVTNSLVKFMYFVPLVSPQPVAVFTNAGNTQCARALAVVCRTNGATFHATCEFEITGAGTEQNVFDQAAMLRGHEESLKAGKPLTHQLVSINVAGEGRGTVEVEAGTTNGQTTVTEVRLRFNNRGRPTPVTINLEDLVYHDGATHPQNEMVARVNELVFRLKGGKPVMEVSLASIKAPSAGNGLWQNFVGGLKGTVANLFIPPLGVAEDGHQAMMNFGLALALQKPGFTFPLAKRLKGGVTASP